MGLGNALLYLIHRLLQTLGSACSLDSFYLVAQPVSPAPLLTPHRRTAITVRLAHPGDKTLAFMGRPTDELERRFAGPGVCFVAERQDELVGFLWLILGTYKEPSDHCTFHIDSPRAAWDLDVFVVPKLRLSPVFALLWTAANEWMCARDIAWTISRVSCFNERSLRSHRRLGMIKLGRLTIARLGPVQMALTSVKPYLNFSVRSGRGLTLHLKPPA